MLSGGDHFCCDGLEPDTRRHVFVSVANLAYGHFVFNGMAPLWDKLRGEQLLVAVDDQQTSLVVHLIAGKPNDRMAKQPYILQYLEFFRGEIITYSRQSFRQQRLLLSRQPILGLANVTLDHYNEDASSELWRDFRDFLIDGFPLLRANYERKDDDYNVLHLTIIQRKANRQFLNLNATITEITTLMKNVTDKSLTVRVVQFEGMPIEKQAVAMSETDILIGADGTGIMNGIYLPRKDSCVIAVLPYGVRELIPGKGRNFETLFTKLGMRFYSMESSAVNQSLEIYRLAKAKKSEIERWFMLKQNLNITGQQLVSAIEFCLDRAETNSPSVV